MEEIDKIEVPFTQVVNELLNDPNISWGAKGLYAYMYSKPKSWQFSAARIALDSKQGRDTVLSLLNELITAGWITKQKKKDGRIVYTVLLKNGLKQPKSEKPTVGISHGGKSRLISNKEDIVIKSNSNKDNIINYSCLPPRVGGSTTLAKLKNFYRSLFWYRLEAEPRVMLNGKDGGVLKSLLKQYSEIQVAALMINHFHWYGPSGSDNNEFDRLEAAAFPITWISPNVNKYIRYIVDRDGVDFNDDKKVYEYVRSYVITHKVKLI